MAENDLCVESDEMRNLLRHTISLCAAPSKAQRPSCVFTCKELGDLALRRPLHFVFRKLAVCTGHELSAWSSNLIFRCSIREKYAALIEEDPVLAAEQNAEQHLWKVHVYGPISQLRQRIKGVRLIAFRQVFRF